MGRAKSLAGFKRLDLFDGLVEFDFHEQLESRRALQMLRRADPSIGAIGELMSFVFFCAPKNVAMLDDNFGINGPAPSGAPESLPHVVDSEVIDLDREDGPAQALQKRH